MLNDLEFPGSWLVVLILVGTVIAVIGSSIAFFSRREVSKEHAFGFYVSCTLLAIIVVLILVASASN